MSSSEIHFLCEQFLHAYQARDLSTLRQLFTRHEELDAPDLQEDLRFFGRSDCETSLVCQFSALEDTDIQITRLSTHVFADGAAACAYVTTNHGGEVFGQDVLIQGLQLNLALERHDGSWRIEQAHWSIPADGSFLHPMLPTPQSETTGSARAGRGNGAVLDREVQQPASPTTSDGFPSGGLAAFATYRQLAARVTERLSQGTFDFSADIAPYVDEQFIEIVDGEAIGLAGVRETFTPLIAATAAGATFSWSVQLEHTRDLTPDIALLITNAQVSLDPGEGPVDVKRYRITNLLARRAPDVWIFLHQHRTEIPTE
ncbi:nuclear transport factor 2 family protein [Streptomyces sp. NPDC057675]|uniref:nuclear transport factor 2 family protein n=1 Tax=Streptomyces sp. NPDC057675 TaxID=3346204 RepID=UPI0036AA33A0